MVYAEGSYVRQIMPFILLAISMVTAAQELHTFSNGEVADAEKINENFQYVLENATGGGGCSAQQEGSSVVITCADGTSGVLASEGTVVVYESGDIGEPELIEYPTGAVVLVDDDGVVLGEASGQDPNNKYLISFDTPWPRVALKNKDDSLTVAHGPAGSATMFYLDENCAEGPFAQSSESSIILVDQTFYWKVLEATKADLLVRSYKFSDSFFDNETSVITECITYETASVRTNLLPAAKYTMPSAVINAKYPVRLEQLP